MAKAILLAEDSPDDELLFRHVLHQNGVANPVMVVRDGAEVVAYFEGQGDYANRDKFPLPKILFLDLRMPKLDGFAVLDWLNKNLAAKDDMLVVVLAQAGNAEDIRRAYEMGANSFLAKPFTKEESENLIRHFSGYWCLPPA